MATTMRGIGIISIFVYPIFPIIAIVCLVVIGLFVSFAATSVKYSKKYLKLNSKQVLKFRANSRLKLYKYEQRVGWGMNWLGFEYGCFGSINETTILILYFKLMEQTVSVLMSLK
jgi:hypothetical protein